MGPVSHFSFSTITAHSADQHKLGELMVNMGLCTLILHFKRSSPSISYLKTLTCNLQLSQSVISPGETKILLNAFDNLAQLSNSGKLKIQFHIPSSPWMLRNQLREYMARMYQKAVVLVSRNVATSTRATVNVLHEDSSTTPNR